MRLLVWGMGVLALMLAIVVGVIAVVGMPTYEVPSVTFEVESSPEKVTRGKELVAMLCRRCHFDAETGRLSGRDLTEIETRLGELRAPNITKDSEVGIGDFSSGELALLLRTGLHPRKKRIIPPPAMPRWPGIADDDLAAIIAFLHSDDPWVEPHAEEPSPSAYSLVAKLQALLRWSPHAYPRVPIVAPAIDDLEAYGAYLVDDLLLCSSCHNEEWGEFPPQEDYKAPGYLVGGAPTTDINGVVLRAANLSPHASGLADWTSEELRRALVDGFGPDGKVVRWPMQRYPGLKEHDIDAIHAHLQRIQAVDNEVEPSPPYKLIGRKAAGGKHLYQLYGCHYCHGPRGKGLADLRGAHARLGTNEELIAFLKDPGADDPLTLMPAWEGVIAEDEYVELCEFIRELGKGGKIPSQK